ncbi:EAL domain-containing protein, partial [Clostridioides difficile]|nr:EAL domain-containing protein [Clostridioides difficile]
YTEKEVIYPGDFIPIFEKNGFIRKIDMYILEQACKEIRSLFDKGISPLPISVNFSRVDFFKKDFIESTNIMKNLGVDVNYYRPPWGHTNIFSNSFVKKYNLKMTLWDVMAEDWEKDSTVDIIINKLMSRTKENSIICLHDAGENSGGAVGAPERTIEALKIAIPKLKASGLKFVTPERM